MDFDFNLPEQEAEKLYSDIRGLLIEKLQNFMFFSDLPPNTIHMIISELVKNIKDHAKTKGYVMIEKDPAPLPGQELLHFVVGDDGPGIAATAESIDNFLQTGFSNG
ncbi:sensor histidine kinase [Patescibacteria group bacterium]|nr:sensor histidine kinase [Patescibacteria group bacterium]